MSGVFASKRISGTLLIKFNEYLRESHKAPMRISTYTLLHEHMYKQSTYSMVGSS
jgi:hypothetical protein